MEERKWNWDLAFSVLTDDEMFVMENSKSGHQIQ
jgi:hypothetical protein